MKALTKAERILSVKLNRDAAKRGTVPAAQVFGRTIYKDAYNVPNTREALMYLAIAFENRNLRRKAYVCEGGQVKHINDLGYGTITDAFIARPTDCKYCVFETSDGKAVLVNMYELMQSDRTQKVHPRAGTTHEFDSVDAAIMYALTIE